MNTFAHPTGLQDEAPWCDARQRVGGLLTIC